MNYANFRKRRLITDILSPADEHGFNVSHPQVQRQPIGFLNRRYLGRFAGRPRGHSFASPAGYFVPPLQIIHQEQQLFKPLVKADKLWADLRLLIFRASLKFKRLTASILDHADNWWAAVAAYSASFIEDFKLPGVPLLPAKYSVARGRYTYWNRDATQSALMIPLLLLFVAAVWLLHSHSTNPPTSGTKPQTAQVIPQTIKSAPSSKSAPANSGSNGRSGNNNVAASSTNAPTQASSNYSYGSPAYSTGYQGSASAPAVQSGSYYSPPATGGMGGGPVSAPAPTTTTPSAPSSSLLPLTLTVPSTDTSAAGKQILQTGSTPVTIN